MPVLKAQIVGQRILHKIRQGIFLMRFFALLHLYTICKLRHWGARQLDVINV